MNMNRILAYIPALIAALLLTSCDVHEFPEDIEPEPQEPQLSLRIEFDLALDAFKEIEYEALYPTRAAAAAVPHLRYIIQAYPDETRAENPKKPLRTWTFTRPRPEVPDTTVTLSIPEGTARLLVWADITDSDGADKHYLTDTFAEIKLPDRNNHEGATEHRQAFRGDLQLASGQAEGTVRMERPMAKYRFITTDLDKFLTDLTRRRHENGIETGDAPELAAKLSQVYVRFVYPRYMACSFNMFTNRPADSWAGVSYKASIRPISDKEAEIGFDYVFVNTHDTSVNVGLEVVERATGQAVARIPALDVPLSRSKVTTVRGPFLTTKAEGGAGIDPDFDGEFNIFIQ